MRILSVLKCIVRKYILRDNRAIIANPFLHFYATDKTQVYDDNEIQAFIRKNLKCSVRLQSTWILKIYVPLHHFDAFLVEAIKYGASLFLLVSLISFWIFFHRNAEPKE